MKLTRFSMKWIHLDNLWKKVFFWGIVLLLASWNYYADFFPLIQAFFLGLLLTSQVIGMMLLGYLWLSKQKKFPRVLFWSITIVFSVFRFLIVFFILQYKLPEWTVFHHPDRVGFYLFFSSAAFLFFGYSYAIYEWGLAARDEYKNVMPGMHKKVEHPIVIRSGGKTVRLLPQDIIYLEAKGEYVQYFARGKSYMCFQRMKTAEREFKKYGLLRAHRSYIINPLFVESYSANQLIMANNQEIPISNTYKKHLLETLGAVV